MARYHNQITTRIVKHKTSHFVDLFTGLSTAGKVREALQCVPDRCKFVGEYDIVGTNGEIVRLEFIEEVTFEEKVEG